MDRRRFLKVSSALGAGALLAGMPLWQARGAARSYFLVTASPEEDVRLLLRAAAFEVEPVVSTAPMQPAAQDLTVVEGGRLLDPSASADLPAALRELAARLRGRGTRGHTWVSVEVPQRRRADVVTFEVDGRVVEQVDRRRSYREIVIASDAGPTAFRLDEAGLRVTQASCRHELCRKAGTRQHGRILCAPARLVATLPGAGAFDAVTG